MKSRGKRILALVTDAYGGHGGIAAYNRDVLRAFCEDDQVSAVVAIARSVPNAVGELPRKLTFDRSGERGAVAFAAAALRHALREPVDLIHCAHVNLAPVARLLSAITKAPWSLSLYGIEAWKPSNRLLVRGSVGKADAYLPISEYTADRFACHYRGTGGRTKVLPNAIHAELYGPGPKPSRLQDRYALADRKVIMSLGRLEANEAYKGMDRIIDALPELAKREPAIAYLICGDGSDRPRLEAFARARGVADRVRFAGLIDEAEKADHYRLADVYAMPSTGEGFGFVFLEAMACGIPVVASDRDGGREAVRLGALGQLVDPFDRDALGNAILTALNAPRRVPDGLGYFAFSHFRRRLIDAIRPLLNRP